MFHRQDKTLCLQRSEERATFSLRCFITATSRFIGMIHQQPTPEPPAIRAHPVNPGRSSQQATASAHSRVDVARLCERLNCLGDRFDRLGITRPTELPESSTVSIEALMRRIETLRKLFAERIGDFPVCEDARAAITGKTDHVN
jgi:hypothetical protein